jgi:uncharacterized membrane protein
MEAYVLDWANLLLRWAHVVVAIAWIGSSFYFVFLDSSLAPAADPEDRAAGVSGELWAVHGGGFYHPQKYLVAPRALPEKLHWFYWESYSTWLTGFALLCVLYLYQARTFLVDPTVFAWASPRLAGAAALGLLAAFWLLYDGACRLWGQRPRGDAIVGLLVALGVVAAAWVACALFAGRAAFVLVGAMMATAMSANVFFWIIPGQRAVIRQMKAGEAVDPAHGQRARQRSVHNTYFTLPVLVAMLSNHYGFLYTGRHAWLVLALLMLAGALIRHSFVLRHRARALPDGGGALATWAGALAGAVLIIGVAIGLKPHGTPAALTPPPSLQEVRALIEQRCAMCHNAALAQKGVLLDSTESIRVHAQQIYQQAVVLKLMPLNNATQITDAERETLRRWFESGGARP